ncbi:ATP-binding cassette domain-containing protein [Saccharibacillus deserti]|uniref:ATP-binding cassette domain-containing protein n=1 Tax=Saccharibacillus deserti TaxID=1634444 RepID=UPI001555E1BE|nr:ATP-binding cassette domain-containing protein [Saccharibacillus deserti]
MLEFDAVHFHYRKGREVLRGATFSVQAGEFVSIVGGNGSGKSTLAKLMNGLLIPREGSVRLDGEPTSDPHHLQSVRRAVGLIFQNPDDQFITTGVSDEIVFGLENIRVPAAEIGERVVRALRAVRMERYADSAPHELSGGQKQRAAIAAVLAMRPRLIVFDEATSMLDPQGRADVLQLMKELHRQGLTVVQITHYMDEVPASDRVLLLDRGAIAFDGTPDDFFASADLESYALEKPFAVRVREALGLTGSLSDDWKERAASQW